MSHTFYNRLWVEAQEDLSQLLQQEMPDVPPKPEKDRMVVAQQLGTLYVRYLQIFRNLELAYDQITHPQKRRVIRLVLDGVMGRLLELKEELVELEISEFQYFDDILQDLKLGPESLEIPIPKYFIKEKMKVLKDREQILSQILDRNGAKDKEEVKPLKSMSLDEAVRLIQVSERARQGRLRAKFMREIHLEEKRERMAKLHGEKVLDPDLAAQRIQKVWRGYIQRKKTKQQREEEMIFLGMVPPPHFNKMSKAEVIAKKTESLRSELQEQCEADYQQALVQVKDTIRETEGLDIKETLQDQIRQWFIECRHATGKFPDFPDEEDGGSKAIFAQKTPEQVAAELAAKEEAKDKKKKEKGKKEGKKKGKKEKDKGKGKKGKGKEEEEEPGWKMNPSQFLPDVASANHTYEGVWQNRNESWNLHQTHDPELIKEDKRKEVEEEIRIQVDELMRQELQNLKLSVDRDKNKKKKGKKGGKKKKKGKKSGKRKKKKEKDLTPDRTIDSLYEELVAEGLLIKPKPVKLSDFIDEYSYLGTTLRQADIEPMPSLSDVKQLLVLYGVLPLGCESVHEKAPEVKALLLAGPTGVGKKMLVNAICNETGANLFNLSPANVSGKYPGKSGLQMMLHMVIKVARQLQPSIIWIEDAEKMFYKKVPKTEKQSDPKRLKKDLPKLLKSIRDDRILVIGTSQRPFDAEVKPLCKVYKKIVLVPRPDYAARLVLWKQLISLRVDDVPSLNYSALAKITDGFTPAHMMQAVDTVLNERRIRQLSQKPLVAAEFLGSLSKQEPVYKEEEEAFKSWYSKTPLGKKRSKAMPGAEEETGKDKGKKKGAKKGKKK
ncbi:dynein regulatory complex protein 11 isoform X2 [Dendropsophus ebraccatus]|uniref:dynein regulatory complex protein 11 isoform X2 n=1 Tax=Dendropsophus ebraccatus TaxID=150705 RepID=UPI00383207A8